GVCFANGFCIYFTQTKMFYFSLFYQVFYSTCNVFNRNIRVEPVLIKQINYVCPQPFQRRFGNGFYVFVTTVYSQTPIPVFETEFCSNHNFITQWFKCFAYQEFVFSITLRRVKESDSVFNCRTY